MTRKGKKQVENIAAVMHAVPSTHADERVHVCGECVCMSLCRAEQHAQCKPSRVRTMCAVEITQSIHVPVRGESGDGNECTSAV